MSGKIYKLKPHHIGLIYGFVLRGEEGIRKEVNSPNPELFTYPDIPHKDYSPEFVDNLVNFCKEFVNNKEAFLQVLNGGIDDICLLGNGCDHRKPSCEGEDYHNFIQSVKLLFGLKPGEKEYYKVSELVEKMQKLKMYNE